MDPISIGKQTIAATIENMERTARSIERLNPRTMTTTEVQAIFTGMAAFLRATAEGSRVQFAALDQIERLLLSTKTN